MTIDNDLWTIIIAHNSQNSKYHYNDFAYFQNGIIIVIIIVTKIIGRQL
jgi:hypothetical protein